MATAGTIEAVADQQKMALKQKDAKDFASTGVFQICRHPAYFGEVCLLSFLCEKTFSSSHRPVPRGNAYVFCFALSQHPFAFLCIDGLCTVLKSTFTDIVLDGKYACRASSDGS